ncbi:MAG: PQQ-binding-like beta-propeller repeat protein [Pirellulales bacterium]
MASIVVLLLCSALGPGNVAGAQEWTRFRGPNGSGQSEATTIPAQWNEGDYLWKAALEGKGNSSPVLWGDKIFLTSANPDDGTRYVLCLSAADGKLLWKRDYPSQTHQIHEQNTLASSTPTVDENRVYCAWSTPEEFTLLAIAHDGSSAWRADLGPFVSQHGFGTSPILIGELLIITNDQDADSFLIAVDRTSGATRWKVPRRHIQEQNTCYSTPCVFTRPGGAAELIVCSRQYGVTSVDPVSGQTNWQAEVLPSRAVSSPIVAGGLILASCGSGAGDNVVVAIKPYANGDKPEVVYQIDKSAPYVPSLVAKDELVFLWGDRGVVTCIDAASGTVHWRERVGGNYFGSPVRVGDRVYCISAEGEVVALAASDRFKLLGRCPLGETSRATPAVADGRMFLRTESHLVAVGKE